VFGLVNELGIEDVRTASWVKPHGVSGKTRGTHNAWEPVLYKPARRCQPGRRDWILTPNARKGGSSLPGRKPRKFCTWLFELLGMAAGDELVDKFPGSEMVTRCWRAANGSLPAPGDVVDSVPIA